MTIEYVRQENIMDSNDLKEVLEKLEAKGVNLDKASEHVKVPAQLLRLYTQGGLVPDRIVNGLKELLEAA